MKKLMLLALVAAIGYGVYTNPDFDAHKQVLGERLPNSAYLDATQWSEGFANLDYTNFLVASATKDTEQMTLVSYGFLGRVTVVDEDWQPSNIDQ